MYMNRQFCQHIVAGIKSNTFLRLRVQAEMKIFIQSGLNASCKASQSCISVCALNKKHWGSLSILVLSNGNITLFSVWKDCIHLQKFETSFLMMEEIIFKIFSLPFYLCTLLLFLSGKIVLSHLLCVSVEH